MPRILAQPENRALDASPDVSLLETLRRNGLILISPCGGEGTCGKCRVQLDSPGVPLSARERAVLGGAAETGTRLACQIYPETDLTVTIPKSSRVPMVRVLAGGADRDVPFFPNVRQRTFIWERLQLGEDYSAFDAVSDKLNARADIRADLDALRDLAETLEDGGEFVGTILGDRLIGIEPMGTESPPIGVALDIGTTTVAAEALRLDTGERIGSASDLNAQETYGADVLSRINCAVERASDLTALQEAVGNTIRGCVARALEKSGFRVEQVYEIVVVGNTTMLHLLTGVSPKSLGLLPYMPVFRAGLDIPMRTMGWEFHPRGNVHLLPSIAGYVGADTVGAALAAGFDRPFDGARLLADIGTNCELVLQTGESLIVCSTPAGPAFEGARVDHGMLAGPGAIERVAFEDDCRIRVIGNVPPEGLCGSGVVDVAAELLKFGFFDETGRMQEADDLPSFVAPNLRGRVCPQAKGNAFEIARTKDGLPILFTQKDVRELQLAKAAIRTGIDVLLELAGIAAEDLTELIVAGGFGNYLNKRNARRLGMIPNLPDERIRYVGNAALVGARLALISTEMRAEAERLARRVRHVQIAQAPDFQMRYAEAMLFDPTLD